MVETPSILQPKPPSPSEAGFAVLKGAGFNQPDLRRNPSLWVRFLVDGPTLIRKTLDLAEGCDMIADLGCGAGWMGLEMVRRSPGGIVKFVDIDKPRLNWAQGYYEDVLAKGAVGEAEFICQDIVTCELAPRSYDLIVCWFFMGCLSDPGSVLRRINEALRPGGYLVYYDACEPPQENLEKLARLRHRLRLGGGALNDLWSQYRRLEAHYAADAVRRYRPKGAPPESHLYHRILETFELVYETRTRAFIDMSIDRIRRSRVRLALPFLKLADELSMLTGYLEGSSRYLIARRR